MTITKLLQGFAALLTASPSLLIAATVDKAPYTGQLEEIIVTAQKKAEDLQKVPVAITAITGAELEKKGIVDLSGIARNTPSITATPYPGDPTTLTIYMRGMGSANPSGDPTSEGGVGVYEDGFYMGRPNAQTFDLADVERIEVLRGPQGTLYGKNTTGGAINIISKQPTGEFGLKQTLEFGNRNEFRSLTTINLPRWHDVSAKLTLLRSSVDGYVKNSGGHDFGESAQKGGRLQLHWDANSALKVDFFSEMGEIDYTPQYQQNPGLNGLVCEFDPACAGFAYFSSAGPMDNAYRPMNQPSNKARFRGDGLTVSLQVNDALTIKSLTGYRDLEVDSFVNWNEVFSSPAFVFEFVAGPNTLKQHQISQELQLTGDFLDGGFSYVSGVYYFHESTSSVLNGSFFTDLTSFSTASSKAVFGQLTWRPEAFSRKLELTAGGRYSKDDHEQGGLGSPTLTESSSRFTPSVIANYQWTGDLGTYAKVATGYRAGGSSITTDPAKYRVFSPETLTSYEIGLKSYWLDRRLRANLSVFHNKFKDMQILAGVTANNPSDTEIYNIGKATIQGVELELDANIFEALTLGLNYAYLDAVIDEVSVQPDTIFDPAVNPSSPYSLGQNVKSLFIIPNAAKNSFSLSGDYTLLRFDRKSLTAHVDYNWKSGYPGSGPGVPGHRFVDFGSHGSTNARLSYKVDLARGDHMDVSLWAKNLGKRYISEKFGTGGLNVDTPAAPAGATGAVVLWSEPATYGISLTYEYGG